MANEVQIQLNHTGWTVYAIVRNSAGQAWNGSSFETYVTGNLGTYDLPMTEQGTASRYYTCDFPSGIAACTHGKPYLVTIFHRLGGSPAETDTPIGFGDIEWKIDESGVTLADSANHGGASAVLTLEKIAVNAKGTDHAVSLNGSGPGSGLFCQGGTSGSSVLFDATNTSVKYGLEAKGGLFASGIYALGGTSSGSGAYFKAQSTGEHGFRCDGNGTGGGAYFKGGAGGAGLKCEGQGVLGAGIYAEGSGGGHGMHCIASSTSGSGMRVQGSSTLGTGLECIGSGTSGAGYGIDAYSNDFYGFRCRGHSNYSDTDIDIHGTLRNFYEVVTFGSVDDISPTSSSFDTDLTEATTDHYKDMVIAFREAPLTGQPRVISAYTFGVKGNITVGDAFTDAPDNGDEFVILGLVA